MEEIKKRKCVQCGKTLVPLRKIRYLWNGKEYIDWSSRYYHIKCSKVITEVNTIIDIDNENEKAIKSQSIRDLKGIRNETEPLFDSV